MLDLLLHPNYRARLHRLYRLLAKAREDDLTGEGVLKWEKQAAPRH